jgi:hypothetical protein
MLVTGCGLVMLSGAFLRGQSCPCAQLLPHTAVLPKAAAEPFANPNRALQRHCQWEPKPKVSAETWGAEGTP